MTKKQVTKNAKTATNVAPVTTVTKNKKIAPATVEAVPAIVAPPESLSKRVTVGAKVAEWRVVPSQRKGMPGYFVQGGSYQMQANGRNVFTCGAEMFFEDRDAAAIALKERQ
jgi:hypothetical protein